MTETVLACSVATCGAEAESVEDILEDYPPALITINDVMERYDMEMPAEQAPYISEEDAEVGRLRADNHRLQEEVKALEKERKELRREVESINEDNNVLQSEVNRLNRSIDDKIERLVGQDKRANSGKGASKESKSKTTQSSEVKDGKSSEGQALGTFEMTYYGMDCAGCSGTTASGLTLSQGQTTYNGMRVLAADTSVLPLHTTVKVTNNDGSSYVGIVKDRGGAIKGRKIDVLTGSEAESKKYGRHGATVEVIEYGDNSYRRE